MTHQHDWQPDGESWEYCKECERAFGKIENKAVSHLHDCQNGLSVDEEDTVRKRRYMCHCGAIKVVTFDD